MPEYEFRFVVRGPFDGEGAERAARRALRRGLGAELSRQGGVHVLSVVRSGPDAVAAVASVNSHAVDLVPGLRLVRLDRGLVGLGEIAERAGRHRGTVRRWIGGASPAGVPFPAPEGTVGGVRCWLWTEVNAWLTRIGLGDGRDHPSRSEMAEIDWRLQEHKLTELSVHSDPRGGTSLVRLIDSAMRSPLFTDYLVARPEVRNMRGQYTIVTCGPDEPAAEVFRRVSRYPHSVVLATAATDVHAVAVAPRPGDGTRGREREPAAEDVVELVPGMTARDWLGLIRFNPGQEYGIPDGDVSATVRTDTILNLTRDDNQGGESDVFSSEL